MLRNSKILNEFINSLIKANKHVQQRIMLLTSKIDLVYRTIEKTELTLFRHKTGVYNVYKLN